MRHYLLAALLGLALPGCTSPTPGDLAYSPAAASAPLAAPVDILPAQPPAADRSVAAASAGFPPPPPCASGPSGCREPIKTHVCRKVGPVTTCDVPPDPDADRTLYTN